MLRNLTTSGSDSNKETSLDDYDDSESPPFESVIVERTDDLPSHHQSLASEYNTFAKSRDQKEFESLSMSQATTCAEQKIIVAKTNSSRMNKIKHAPIADSLIDTNPAPISSPSSSSDAFKYDQAIAPSAFQPGFPLSYWQSFLTSRFNSETGLI